MIRTPALYLCLILAASFAVSAGAVSINQRPTVAMVGPLHAKGIFDDESVLLRAQATDPDGSIAGVSFYNSTNLLGPAEPADYSLNLGALVPGKYFFTAVATDNNGLSATSTVVRVTVLDKKWEFAPQQLQGSPTFGPDGGVYISADTSLVALNSDGSIRWRFQPEMPITSMPTVDQAGNVYVGLYDNSLCAIDASGKEKWRFPTNGRISSSAALGRDGTIYFGSANYKVYALTPQGSKKWEYTAEFSITTSPAVAGNGTVYFTAAESLHALTPTGALKWKVPVNGTATTSPAVGGDGTIYFGALGRELHAITPQGEKRWAFKAAAAFNLSSPIVGSDGTVYCAAGKVMYAVDARGQKRWEFTAGDEITGTPSLGSDGSLYFTSHDRNVYALDGSGKVAWFLPAPWRLGGTVALDRDGTLCFGFGEYPLYAISTGTTLDSGAWPTFQADSQRRGQAFLLPTVSLTSPAEPALISSGQPITLRATGSTPNGDITRLEFYSGTNLITTLPTPPFTFEWTNAPVGVHFISVRIVDSIGASAASPSIRVEVVAAGTPPQFTLQPISQKVANGSSVELTSAASGSPPLQFQWYKDGSPILSATNSSLRLASVQLSDSAYYTVRVLNSTAEIESTPAILSVLQPANIKWTSNIGLQLYSSPALSQGTRIIIGSDNRTITQTGPAGQYLWSYETQNYVRGTAAVGADGTIYIPSRDSFLYALSTEGDFKWDFPAGGDSSPALSTNGLIYLASGTNLYAITSKGALEWVLPLQESTYSSPAVGSDGTIYLGTLSRYIAEKTNRFGYFLAISPTGQEKWRYTVTNDIVSSPAIASDGTVVFGCNDRRVYALDPDGKKKWELLAEGPVSGSPAIGLDGTIYIGSVGPRQNTIFSGIFYALTPAGKVKWKLATTREIIGAPALAQDGTIYAGARNGIAYALNPNGTIKWEMSTNWEIQASPSIAFDGTTYFANFEGKLLAFEGNSPLAKSSWPKFRRDPRNTGNAGIPVEADTFYYPFSSNTFDDWVRAVVISGEKIYAGGYFTIAGGVPAQHVALWTGKQWTELAEGVNGEVVSLAADEANLYAGGYFTRAGNVEARFVAKWNGSGWQALGSGLDEPPQAMALHNGALYVAGAMRSAGGQTVSSIAKWDGSRWSAIGSGLFATAHALRVINETNIVIGGDNFGTMTEPLGSVAHWNGTRWSRVGNINGSVRSLVWHKDELYAGGHYISAGTQDLSGLGRFNGTSWTNVDQSVAEGFPFVFALESDGTNLYAGGTFRKAGGKEASCIARFDGIEWFPLGAGVQGGTPRTAAVVSSIAVRGRELFAGGAFTSAGGSRKIRHFARWDGTAWSSFGPLLHFIDGKFQLVLTDQLGRTYGIEVSSDVVNWTRVATYTNLNTAIKFIDETAGDAEQRFYRAVTP